MHWQVHLGLFFWETQVSLEVLSDLTNQTLEWQFADQKLSGLLVTTDLTESDCSGTIPMRFLDAEASSRETTIRSSSMVTPGGGGGLEYVKLLSCFS